jgi:hypothetical protein
MLALAPGTTGGFPVHVAEPFALADPPALEMEPNAQIAAPLETRNDPPDPTAQVHVYKYSDSEMVCISNVEKSMKQDFESEVMENGG